MRRSLFVALAAYLFCRAALGEALNPLNNGPDEAAHVEYVRAVASDPLARVTGVEARQLPAYYLLASLPWRLTEGRPESTRFFAVRLLSGLCGVATLALIWRTARAIWPGRPAPPTIAAAAVLAPGHLYLLSSVTNDPLATTLATLSFLAALRLWMGPPAPAGRWWALWLGASAAALVVKPTALPVVAGAAAALALRARRRLWSNPPARAAMLAIGAVVVAGIVFLALQEPTSGPLPALARFWPAAILRAPFAYVARGGLAESFRTWWHGYDYLVRWPASVEAGLAGAAGLLALAALAGLALIVARRSPAARPGGLAVPAIVWWCAGAQVAFVLARFGFGDVLRIEMGGAAQAKAFFTGMAPLALLWAAGLVAAGAQLRLSERDVARGALAVTLAVDAASLAVTTWQHYRWWQVGV